MMSETPPKDIVDKWEHCARRFGTLYGERYLPEKTTPYMHVFVYHVGFFLRKLGNIECFANYDIESWHKINKRVKNLGTVPFGGRSDPTKSSLGRQQLQYQHRTRFANNNTNSTPEQNNQNNTTRKQGENNVDQNLQAPTWTQRQLNASTFRNPFFESVINGPAEDTVDAVMGEAIDESNESDKSDKSDESHESELLTKESTVEMTLIHIRNNYVQLINATPYTETQHENNENTTDQSANGAETIQIQQPKK